MSRSGVGCDGRGLLVLRNRGQKGGAVLCFLLLSSFEFEVNDGANLDQMAHCVISGIV